MATTKKPALGKALGSLLGDMAINPALSKSAVDGELVHLAIELLTPGKYQPRRTFESGALEELASSIRAQGILQPIVARKVANRQYEIIAGERRWRAAQLAGLAEVPVLIRDISDQTAIALALIENIQREDLNPIEEAVALHRLIAEFKLTHQEAADAVGKSRVTVTNLLRLMNLQDDVKNMLQQGKLEMGHARALLALEPLQQRQLAQMIIAKQLTVRQTEALVQRMQAPTKKSQAISRGVDPNILALQTRLSEQLGAAVEIAHNSNGKGSLIIHYHSVNELDGILAKIR